MDRRRWRRKNMNLEKQERKLFFVKLLDKEKSEDGKY